MVPMCSIESWSCLKFHEFAFCIETLRDCFESHALHLFFQHLTEALGGEE